MMENTDKDWHASVYENVPAIPLAHFFHVNDLNALQKRVIALTIGAEDGDTLGDAIESVSLAIKAIDEALHPEDLSPVPVPSRLAVAGMQRYGLVAEDIDQIIPPRGPSIIGGKVLRPPAQKVDAVNRPAHYDRFPIEPTYFAMTNALNWLEASVLKYICRYPYKNGEEDIRKARRCLIMYFKFLVGDPEWSK